MISLLKRLFTTADGYHPHRPMVGWALGILAGIYSGLLFPFALTWLVFATVTLFIAWLKPLRRQTILLLLSAMGIAAWHAADVQCRLSDERARIDVYRSTSTPMIVETTIGDDARLVTPQKGQPYLAFTGKDVTFDDHTAWVNTALNVRFYFPQGEQPPQRGERWKFPLHLYHLRGEHKVSGRANYNEATHLVEQDTIGSISYMLGSLREAFARNLSYTFQTASTPSSSQSPTQDALQRLVHARNTQSPLRITLTVDPDHYQIKQPKRGAPYCSFEAFAACFEDQVPLPSLTLTIQYRNPEGVFPQPNERWQMEVVFNKGSSPHPKRMTARTTAQQSQRLMLAEANPHRKSINEPPPQPALTDGDRPFNPTLPLKSILLGGHYKLPYDTYQCYAAVGIIHVFAISGLHVGILVSLIFFLLRWCTISLSKRFFILLPLLLCYLLLTGAPPSATRASIMALIYCFAMTPYRRFDSLTALLITAVIAALNPLWVIHIGALLSFCVMGGILLFFQPLTLTFARLFHAEPSLEDPHPINFKTFKRCRYHFAQICALTLAAWIAALPLCIHFFGRLSFIGLLLNLVVPTLTIVIVWCAALSALLGFIHPLFSMILNTFNGFLLTQIDALARWAFEIPYAFLDFDLQPHWFITLFFEISLILLGLFFRLKMREHLHERLGTLVRHL